MNVPCLFITWNRIEYSKQALQSVIESDVSEIFIWDNNSEIETKKYLLDMSGGKIKQVYFNERNEGIRAPMNWFIEQTKGYEVVCKIDNDTCIPKDFCKQMIPHLKKADIVQAKHKIIEATCPGGWNAFIRPMRKEGQLCFHHFVGGSGIVVKRKVLSALPHTDWMLYSWMTWQRSHPELKKAFANDCEIKLLDEAGYEDYPEYYKQTGRI